jgi:hypothetical protein
MWKKKEEKKEEKEEDLLKELCGDDKKLYDLLSSSLYINPIAAIPKTDLESLIEEAEKSLKDENYQGAMQKYQTAVDKAILEAAQNPGEKARYIKVIQDLSSKTVKLAEKIKEKGEKEGFVSTSIEGRIKHYEFMIERTEDVIKIASLFYNERLEELGEIERREERSINRGESIRKEERADRESKERRVARGKDRKEMGREDRKEAEKEDKIEEKKEKERAEVRKEEGKEAEREEKKIKEVEKERRETRREARGQDQ